MIRKNRGIKGIEFCGHIFNIVAYADDATGFVNDLESARLLIKTFGIFSKYSGLKLNESKTEICCIGVMREKEVAPFGMKSSNLLTSSVKILGVHFTYNDKIMRGKK